MNTELLSTPSPLALRAARQLRDGLATLLRAEQTAAADFLLALADFDRRRGWEPLGHASLFAFLHVDLGLSKGGAYFRMTAARLVLRFPDVIHPLREGKLCITTVVEVAKVLTEENHAEVLPRFFGLSASEARELTAALAPREAPPMRAMVTRPAAEGRRLSVPEVPPVPQVVPQPVSPPVPQPVPPPVSPPASPPPHAVQSTEPTLTHPVRGPERRDGVEPLSADLRRLHLTVSVRLLEKIAAAREGLSHARPSATTEQVLEAALDLLLEKQARTRAQVKKPRRIASPTPAADASGTAAPVHRRTGPREAIPAAVRRAVWYRDGGRCSWPLDAGGCCGSTHRLELDHVVPWARGGDATAANLRLVCHKHNTLAARQAFGARCVGRYSGSTRGAAPSR
jgi:hypothetical protein